MAPLMVRFSSAGGARGGFLFVNVNHDVGFESSESIPISLGYVLASLRAQGGGGVILDDLQDRPLGLGTLEEWIRRLRPSAIGFTTYQSTMDRIRQFARYVKSAHGEIRIVLGGPQAAPMPGEALDDLPDVDVLVRASGEGVIRDLSRAIEGGRPLEEVAGIACRADGRVVETERGPEPPEDLDAYPSPYLTGALNLTGKGTAILLSSRGCEHGCRFCITPGLCRGKIRYHSIDRVVAEMELLARTGIERFWFADPNFTADRARTERLLEAKKKRGIATPFWCQTRADLVDRDLLKQLRGAGADTVAFGLESGSPGVLDATNKRIELSQLRDHIERAQELGMNAELFSIFGLPGETPENARETLEFVRSLDVPIEANSGSQQMQLYFGSAYERAPERFGIEPLVRHRPAYLSVGDEYETSAMSTQELRRVRNLWALANQQLERDVYYKQKTFDILDFLLTSRADLEEEPAFHAYGALAAAAVEELSLVREFLEGLSRTQAAEGPSVEEIIGSLRFFREVDEPAGPADRVIFDARSWMGGVPFMGVTGKYWDALLGRGLLLPAFERGLTSSRPGQETRFTFVFPADYHEEELRGREVEVEASIRKVFRLVRPRTLEDVRGLTFQNRYPFPDLDVLREQNEILYYFALRDADPRALLAAPAHFLALVHRLAKLGKRDEVRRLGGFLAANPAALCAFADALAGSGKREWALEYYERAPEGPSSALKRARCLLAVGQPERAVELLETAPEAGDLEWQETLLACLEAARPRSGRIAPLDREVLDLRVKAALAREMGGGPPSTPPVVHGWPPEDAGEA